MKTWIFFSVLLQHADNIWNKTTAARRQSWGQTVVGWKEAGLRRHSVTAQSVHTLPFRKHSHSILHRPSSGLLIIPKYMLAVTPEREACYCKWNLLSSFPEQMCSEAAMGGSINFWNAGSHVGKHCLSLFQAAAALCCVPGSPAAQLRNPRAQRFRCMSPACGKTPRRVVWEGYVMDSCYSSCFPD